LQQINDSTLKRPAAGQSHKLDAVESAKKQEAYRMALKCVLFPMIDHTEIRKSQESVDAETSAKQQQQQVTVQVLKELSKSISKQLKADKLSDQIKQRECDPLFVKALVAFQREVFTSKQIETLCSNGATFDDLMAIMQRNIEHELENGESNEVLVTERLERFGEMLKKAADFVCTAEMMRDRKRQERAAKREKKKANNSSMPDASEICKSNAVGVESAKNHYRSRTTPDNGNSKDSLTAIPEGTTSDIGSGVLEITEFVRHALAVDRRLHLKTMAELQTSHVAKVCCNHLIFNIKTHTYKGDSTPNSFATKFP
jgi:hypothetical protein